MTYLQDKRYAEIARWVEAYQRRSVDGTNLITRGGTHADPQFTKQYRVWKRTQELSGLAVHETERTLHDKGTVSLALDAAIKAGRIDRDEAEEFLNQRFPESRYSGSKLGDLKGAETALAASDAALKLSEDPSRLSLLDAARAAQGALGIGALSGNASLNPVTTRTVALSYLPMTYDATSVRDMVGNAVLELEGQIAQVANGKIRFQPNSISGESIRPGTLTSSRLDPVESKTMSDLPGPDQAVILKIGRATDLDNYAPNTLGANQDSECGPGRIWRVVDVEYPAGFNPVGPTRYRLVSSDMKFGRLNMVWRGTHSLPPIAGELLDVTYGLVIVGIPHAISGGPKKILKVEFVESCPASHTGFDQRHVAHVDNSPYFARLRDDFLVNRREIFGIYQCTYRTFPVIPAANTQWITADYPRQIEGFGFGLIVGENEREIAAQVNSHHTGTYSHITGNAMGDTASCPRHGIDVLTPGVASISGAANAGYGAREFFRDDNHPVTANDTFRVTQGAPFDYNACASMRTTEDHFSVSVNLYPACTFDGADVAAIVAAPVTPQDRLPYWWRSGIEIIQDDARPTAIDIVVK